MRLITFRRFYNLVALLEPLRAVGGKEWAYHITIRRKILGIGMWPKSRLRFEAVELFLPDCATHQAVPNSDPDIECRYLPIVILASILPGCENISVTVVLAAVPGLHGSGRGFF